MHQRLDKTGYVYYVSAEAEKPTTNRKPQEASPSPTISSSQAVRFPEFISNVRSIFVTEVSHKELQVN